MEFAFFYQYQLYARQSRGNGNRVDSCKIRSAEDGTTMDVRKGDINEKTVSTDQIVLRWYMKYKSNVPTANVLNLSSNLNCSQFVQHYGSVALPSNVEGGFYTDARGEVRRSADQKAQRQIQKLKNDK